MIWISSENYSWASTLLGLSALVRFKNKLFPWPFQAVISSPVPRMERVKWVNF